MAEDPKTRSLLFCVMDGHGEDGDKVSQNIKSKFANYLFKHKDFGSDIQAALTDVIVRCETEVLRDSSIETDFSGTTFTCAIIRGNHCTLCNIGDSRTSIAYRNKSSGGVSAINLTIDHKPDLPAEKVMKLYYYYYYYYYYNYYYFFFYFVVVAAAVVAIKYPYHSFCTDMYLFTILKLYLS
jgi:serine/threonine protein phosphatase PrpC